MLDYLNSFQIISSAWVINIVGAITGKFKLFSIKEIKAIRRLIYMVPVAAMLYNEIGCSKLNGKTWISFGHALLVQVFLHLLVLAYVALHHNKDELMIKFTLCSIAYCETDFFYYSYALAQVLFNKEYIIHATLACFVQYLIVVPFHTLLAFFYLPNTLENLNNSGKDDEDENAIEQKEDEEESSSNDELEEVDGHIKEIEIDGEGNPITIDDSSSNKEEDVETPPDVPETEKKEKEKKPWTRTHYIIYAFINQFTVCSILGIIWSAIGIEMPLFMSSFVYDLEKATIAASFFITGSIIADHPFKGCPIIETSVGCVFHFIIEPLLSVAVSYMIGMDKSVAIFLLFANACPTAIYGHMLSQNIGFETSLVSYTYYWTSILALPVLLIWVAIVNETSLLK